MSALREILAHFSFEVDDKKVHEAGEGIEGMIEKVKGLAVAAGAAFMVKEIFEFAHGMAEAAIEVEHSAAAFGLSTTEMQEWQLAAKASGVSTETLDTSFKMLAKSVGGGVGPGVQALAKLGVQVKDASGQIRPMSDLFADAGDAIGTIKNAGERAAIGTQVFGRQFIKILPLISKGKEGMAELRAKLAELGGGFDEAFIEKSKEVEEQTAFLGQGWTSLKVTLAAYLLPALTWLMSTGVGLVKMFIDFAKNTSAVAAVLTMLGIAGLVALAPLLPMFAALLLPVLGLATAFLLLQDFFTFLAGGRSEFGEMLDKLFGPGSQEIVRKFFTDIKKGWDDIAMGASSFGDLAMFMWNMVKNAALYAVAYAGDAFTNLWNAISKGAMYAAAYLKDAFNNALHDVIATATKALNIIGKIPGMGDLTKGLTPEDPGKGHAVADLDANGTGAKPGTMVADMDRIVAAQNQAIGTAQLKRQNDRDLGEQNTTNHTTIHVNVAPGTPEKQARDVAAAAAAGAHKGTNTPRAQQAALVPGRG